MNEILKISTDNDNYEPTVSARSLYKALEVNTRFNDWFPRMCEYGFTEGKDFYSILSKTSEMGGRPSSDYNLSIAMAKEICMIQRSDKGKQFRQYFLSVEADWNTPEKVMARALLISSKKIKELDVQIEEMKPKALFADAVSSSGSGLLVRDYAKLLKQNGIDTGEKRLYTWFRNHGYICQSGTMPTQRAMELGLFRVAERVISQGDDSIITKTTYVTGKGQGYFFKKMMEE